MKHALLSIVLLLATPTLAQHPQNYSAHQGRAIKALSSDEIEQYRAGAGLSFALAAELNHYPGPMHALELADQLELTKAQRDALKALMDSHKAEARAIGVRLVEAERELDRLFASGEVTTQSLRDKVLAAGELRSEYRLSHLDTHQRTRAVLTAEQTERYDRLRGYDGGPMQDGHKHLR